MSAPDLSELVGQYLDDARLMQLATAVDDQPWVCSVWFAADDQFNIYWFSTPTRRHSLEIATNVKVAAAFALAHTPANPPRGLQLQGIASVVDDQVEEAHARAIYAGRIFPDEKVDELLHHPQRAHLFYRIKPSLFVLFDAVNFADNPRQELAMT